MQESDRRKLNRVLQWRAREEDPDEAEQARIHAEIAAISERHRLHPDTFKSKEPNPRRYDYLNRIAKERNLQ